MFKNAVALALTAGSLLLASVGGAAALGNHPDWCDEQGSKNAAERTICSTRELWVLDDNLNVAFAEAERHIGSQKHELVSSQANWLKETRNSCGANVGCLTRVYESRISTLHDIARRGHM
jgi:uncharacterized protein